MEGQKMVKFDEHRRANRVEWERPVRITKPVTLSGKAVNASAVGLLMRVDQAYPLVQGDYVSVEIPRADGTAILTRRGRITRVETNERDMFLGLELI